MKFLLGLDTALFVLEIRKGAVTLGYEKKRFQSWCFFAYMLDQAH